MKVANYRVTADFLKERSSRATDNGYDVPKYIAFCWHFILADFEVRLTESRISPSKYVEVRAADRRRFKVRFSNHQPVYSTDDCDFVVGKVGSGRWQTTENAIAACENHFQPANP